MESENEKARIEIVVVEPGKRPYLKTIERTLESMQAVVGGLIEQVCPFEDPVSLICNEEGKLEGLPISRALRDENGRIYDLVAGTFFITYSPPESDTFESLPEELAKKYIGTYALPECVFKSDGHLLVLKYDPKDCTAVY